MISGKSKLTPTQARLPHTYLCKNYFTPASHYYTAEGLLETVSDLSKFDTLKPVKLKLKDDKNADDQKILEYLSTINKLFSLHLNNIREKYDNPTASVDSKEIFDRINSQVFPLFFRARARI